MTKEKECRGKETRRGISAVFPHPPVWVFAAPLLGSSASVDVQAVWDHVGGGVDYVSKEKARARESGNGMRVSHV